MNARWMTLAAALTLTACGQAASQNPAPAAGVAGDTVPKGYGSLRRDDITVQFSTDQLQVQVLPLTEGLIRLLAPDTYQSLSDLVASRQDALLDAGRRAGVRNPTLVLVTFYGLTTAARFTPENLTILARGQLFRPVGILPLTPTWATQQLDLRQQVMAIYLYDEGVDWRDQQLVIAYQNVQSTAWGRSVRRLNEEQARVEARIQSRQNP